MYTNSSIYERGNMLVDVQSLYFSGYPLAAKPIHFAKQYTCSFKDTCLRTIWCGGQCETRITVFWGLELPKQYSVLPLYKPAVICDDWKKNRWERTPLCTSTALNDSGTGPGSPFIVVNSEWANLKYLTLKTGIQSCVIVIERNGY